MPAGYVKEDNPYRLGAAYFSYGNYRVGIDSDRHVRHPIQNIGAHWFVFISYDTTTNSYLE